MNYKGYPWFLFLPFFWMVTIRCLFLQVNGQPEHLLLGIVISDMAKNTTPNNLTLRQTGTTVVNTTFTGTTTEELPAGTYMLELYAEEAAVGGMFEVE